MFSWFSSRKGQVDAWATMRQVGSEPPLPVRENEMKEISLEPFVQACLQAGYHRYALAPSGSRGLSKKDYAALWPSHVQVLLAELFETPSVVLVDRTLSAEGLARLLPMDSRTVHPKECRDLVPVPSGADGATAKRYIAFVSLGFSSGHRSFTTSADDFCARLPEEYKPLVAEEAVHVSVQYRELLRGFTARNVGPYSMRVPGTTVGTKSVMCVKRDWYGNLILSTSRRDICANTPGKDINDFCGNGSRLTRVIQVA